MTITPVISPPDPADAADSPMHDLIIPWQRKTFKSRKSRHNPNPAESRFCKADLLDHVFIVSWVTAEMSNYTNSSLSNRDAGPGRWELHSDFGSKSHPEFMAILFGAHIEEEALKEAEIHIRRYFAMLQQSLKSRMLEISNQPLGQQTAMF